MRRIDGKEMKRKRELRTKWEREGENREVGVTWRTKWESERKKEVEKKRLKVGKGKGERDERKNWKKK